MLTSIQEDALREYMNIFIGQAASLLSEMVNKKIKLTTPNILFLSPNKDKQEYDSLKPSFFNSYVVSSSINFGKTFSGNAQLIFPKYSSQTLVRLCLGENEEIEEDGNLTDTDFDVIREIGNVLLNAVLGALGNLLNVKLEYTLPEVHTFFFPDKEKDVYKSKETYVLIISNSFTVDEVKVDGVILIVLNMESILELIKKIDEVLVDVYG
ncbi:chemotaxis protein CheC [Anaerovorax odorimutans]|uniref:chemotaxis protein CheC n=1 Tax=Anaerovorax odorimutans TaxID=109327 RepID=UPI000410C568|nr:chemotaxis protein CheC [Anaerovorax odorimutans]